MPIWSAQPSIRMILVMALLGVAAMRFVMLFTFEVNWDEFLNLSMLYDHQRGELRELLQTGFIHLLHWVPYVSGNEVDQIIAARVLVFGAGILTSLAIYRTAHALASFEAALFAVLSYWVFSFTLRHGVSLRTDPLAACAMMCALSLSISGVLRPRQAIVAGSLAGLAGFFTIKAVFFIPALIIITVIRGTRARSFTYGLTLLATGGITALISFVGLIAAHALSFDQIASPLAFLDRTTGATLGTVDYAVFKNYASLAIRQNILLVIIVMIGAAGAVRRLRSRSERGAGLYALALLTPLLSPVFYRDFYPYFYPFVLAPVMVVASLAFDDLLRRFGGPVLSALVLAMLLSGGIVFANALQQPLAQQRLTLDVIHKLFAPSTTYIDARSMVPSMAKRGPFMSQWGMTDYRNHARPVMQDILERDAPQFILANNWRLNLHLLSADNPVVGILGLLPEDLATLKNNYAPFWGPLYVPGKTILPSDKGIDVVLSGNYRINGGGDLAIDGQSIPAGGKITLSKGHHAVSSRTGATLVLDVPMPDAIPPTRPLFGRF
ncbi:glycosyltransferase family 39 protein [Pseudogemmobacter sp. W21_MBD1_M6]|uniref:glycosyltransferase family 39 protein n=1 Tax=Pseudogemmobacter sp. W21_MBD1_M6 TaxID=3240271 RepID=UPI003F9DBEC3